MCPTKRRESDSTVADGIHFYWNRVIESKLLSTIQLFSKWNPHRGDNSDVDNDVV